MSEQELTQHQDDFMQFLKKETASAMIKLAGYVAGVVLIGGVGGFFFIKSQAAEAVSKVGDVRSVILILQQKVDEKADLKLVLSIKEDQKEVLNNIYQSTQELKRGQDRITTMFIDHLNSRSK